MRRKRTIAPLVAAVAAWLILAFDAAGQVPVKKKPAPSPAGATVVSRAEDYQNSSSQIIEPATPPVESAQTDRSDELAARIKEIQNSIRKLEAGQKNEFEEKQKRLLLNLDILTRAEQRADTMRKQRFEMIEKENAVRSRIDQIDADMRPEVIEKSVAMAGTLRPEELREARRKSLEAEKRNLQSLLNEISATRASLEQNVLRADALVEKLRLKLEKDIDSALDDAESEKPE
jgi:hypothetical protein